MIERRDNPGFGAASNVGLERVTEAVTILLNPDIIVHDGALTELARRAHETPDALHAPRLLNTDGSVQRSAHPLPGTLGAFLPALVPPAAAAAAGPGARRTLQGDLGDAPSAGRSPPVWRRRPAR